MPVFPHTLCARCSCSPAAPPAAQVAEGEAHVYPRLAPTCEWDTAAAHAIVEEAGGVVLQAGRCDGKGTLLEDWKVSRQAGRRGGSSHVQPSPAWLRSAVALKAAAVLFLLPGCAGQAGGGAVQQGAPAQPLFRRVWPAQVGRWRAGPERSPL